MATGRLTLTYEHDGETHEAEVVVGGAHLRYVGNGDAQEFLEMSAESLIEELIDQMACIEGDLESPNAPRPCCVATAKEARKRLVEVVEKWMRAKDSKKRLVFLLKTEPLPPSRAAS